jgi:MFS family permease
MRSNLSSLRALFVSMGSIHLASAALGTFVALRIAEIGGSQEMASLVAASYSLGFLVGCFYTYRPLAKVGYVRAFAAAAALCSIFTLLLSWTDSGPAMLVARFVIGVATAGLYAVGDAWITGSAPASSRGSILAIYATVLGIASVVSQGVVAVSSQDLAGGFVLIAAAFSMAIVVLALTKTEQPEEKGPASVRLMPVFRGSPTAFFGVFVNGIVVTIFLAILPYQASTVGISAATITTSIAMAYAGRILFQYPLGRISDRMDRRIVISGISLVATMVLLLIAIVVRREGSGLDGDPSMDVRLVAVGISILLGGTLLPLYSVLTAHAMDRTPSIYVPSTAVTLLFVYSLGCVTGPVLVAVMSAVFGGRPMAWMMFVLMLAFSLFSVWRMTRRPAVSQEEHVVMAPTTATSVEMAIETKR